jgi:hypothetical protein
MMLMQANNEVESVTVNQVLLVTLTISTIDEDVEPFKHHPNATISPIDDTAS